MLERLHKILARAGVAALRPAEDMILQGRVAVNGRVVRELGARADAETDVITVDGTPIDVPRPTDPHQYVMLHKPVGVISTARDTHDRPTVVGLVPNGSRLFPVGRLDADSEGLILLTDDGDLAYRLTHPRFEVDKEYRVLVDQTPPLADLRRWREGVELDGEMTVPAWVEVLERTDEGTWLRIVMREGRKRQIREVARLLGLHVHRLIRVREGPLQLADLAPGTWRLLTQTEIEALRTHTQHVPSREADEERERRKMSDEGKRRRLRVVRRPARDEGGSDQREHDDTARAEATDTVRTWTSDEANTASYEQQAAERPERARFDGERPQRDQGERGGRYEGRGNERNDRGERPSRGNERGFGNERGRSDDRRPYGNDRGGNQERPAYGNDRNRGGSSGGGYRDRSGPQGGGGYRDRSGPQGGYRDRSGPSSGGGYRDRSGPPSGGFRDRGGSSGGGYRDRSGPPSGGFRDRGGPSGGGFRDRGSPSGGGYRDRGGPQGGYRDRSGPPSGGGYRDRSGPQGGFRDRNGPQGGGYRDRSGPSGGGFRDRGGSSGGGFRDRGGSQGGGFRDRSGPQGGGYRDRNAQSSTGFRDGRPTYRDGRDSERPFDRDRRGPDTNTRDSGPRQGGERGFGRAPRQGGGFGDRPQRPNDRGPRQGGFGDRPQRDDARGFDRRPSGGDDRRRDGGNAPRGGARFDNRAPRDNRFGGSSQGGDRPQRENRARFDENRGPSRPRDDEE